MTMTIPIPIVLSAVASSWLTILGAATLKGTALLAAAWASTLVLRGSSSRHRAWSLALAGLLILPALEMIPSDWGWRAWTTEAASSARADLPPVALPLGDEARPEPTSPPPMLPARESLVEARPMGTLPVNSEGMPSRSRARIPAGLVESWPVVVFVAWASGALVAIAPFVLGLASTRALGRRSAAVEEGPWAALAGVIARGYGLGRRVRLRRGEAGMMPVTWGLWRPVVLLPEDAEGWPAERLRAVLLHELAHVVRLDILAQHLARLACAVYWFNPLVWVAAGRLRVEAERASDDLALGAGLRASDYASELMRLVDELRPGAAPATVALAMARRGVLEGRLRAILDAGRDRRGLSRRRAVALGLATLGVLATLGTARLSTGQEAPEPPKVVTPSPRTDAVEPPASPTPKAHETPWRKWVGGVATVELVAVSTKPPGAKTWWRPDGRALTEPPRKEPIGIEGASPDDARRRAFLLRVVTGSGDADVSVDFRPSSGGSSYGVTPGVREGARMVQWLGVSTNFPEGQATCSIRVGVAGGPWKMEGESHGGNESSGGSSELLPLLFARPRESDGVTSLVISTRAREGHVTRVMAVERSGTILAPSRSATGSGDVLKQFDVEFKRPLSEIASFRVESRPIAWTEFKDVPLNAVPGLEPAAPEVREPHETTDRHAIAFRLVDGTPVPKGPIPDELMRLSLPALGSLRPEVLLDESHVNGAEALGWGSDGWSFAVNFTTEGVNAFAAILRAHPRRRLALVLNGRVVSASILEPEPGLVDYLSGRMEAAGAKSLAAEVLDVVDPGTTHPRPVVGPIVSRPSVTIGDGLTATDDMAFATSGTALVSLGMLPGPGGGQGARAWNLRSGGLVHKQIGPSGATSSFALSPDATRAVSLDGRGQMVVWDTSRGRTLRALPGHENSAQHAAFSPDGRWLATAGSSRAEAARKTLEELKLWDLGTGMPRWTLSDHRVEAIAFSPDGKILAGGDFGREILLLDAETGKLIRTLPGPRGIVRSLAFSPDGATLACGDMIIDNRVQKGVHLYMKTLAGEVTLWDVRSGDLKRTLAGHDNAVGSVAFTPDGRYVASGCFYDYTARVWNSESGELFRTFGIHDVGVKRVVFSPDGATLATIGSEGKMRLWDWKQEP